MPDSPKLKPCPFCMSENVESWSACGKDEDFIHCNDCKASGPKGLTLEGAIKSWNDASTQIECWQKSKPVIDTADNIKESDHREIEDLRQIALLIGRIFYYGNFIAESINENDLEKLLRKRGYFFQTEEEVLEAPLRIYDTTDNTKLSAVEDGTGSLSRVQVPQSAVDGGPQDPDFTVAVDSRDGKTSRHVDPDDAFITASVCLGKLGVTMRHVIKFDEEGDRTLWIKFLIPGFGWVSFRPDEVDRKGDPLGLDEDEGEKEE